MEWGYLFVMVVTGIASFWYGLYYGYILGHHDWLREISDNDKKNGKF
jgi:hypothetical protein